jgi:hypothetical protein
MQLCRIHRSIVPQLMLTFSNRSNALFALLALALAATTLATTTSGRRTIPRARSN